MSKPKKKLPTGPISIPSKTLVTAGKDSNNVKENKILVNKKPDSTKTDSSFTDSKKPESTFSLGEESPLIAQEKQF